MSADLGLQHEPKATDEVIADRVLRKNNRNLKSAASPTTYQANALTGTNISGKHAILQYVNALFFRLSNLAARDDGPPA